MHIHFHCNKNEVGDFFGHESILTMCTQGTSSKNLLLFPEIMLWNEDVPLISCNFSVEVAPCRHMGLDFTSAWTAIVSLWDLLYVDWHKMSLNLRDASVPDVLYTFLVTTITCLTSEKQPWLDGEFSVMFHASTKWQNGGHFVQQPMMQNFTQQFTVTLKIRKKKRLWQFKEIQMKQDQSLLKKKKIHCVIWNALFFTNVIDHWL